VEDASVVLPAVHEEHLVVVLIGGHEVRVPFDEGRATGLGTQALGPRCTQLGSQSLDWMRSAAKTLRSIGRAQERALFSFEECRRSDGQRGPPISALSRWRVDDDDDHASPTQNFIC
jgi:hypothetical protein